MKNQQKHKNNGHNAPILETTDKSNSNPRGERYSLRKAINMKCKDCIYDPLDTGSWVQQVKNCQCFDCPLHEVRRKK